jgi:hypothetical protein
MVMIPMNVERDEANVNSKDATWIGSDCEKTVSMNTWRESMKCFSQFVIFIALRQAVKIC